jgi:YHYH protein
MRARRLALVAAGLLAVAAPLGMAIAKSSTKSTSTAKALRKARWASNVSVSVGGGKMTWRSNGIPNAGVLTQYAVPNGGAMGNPSPANSHAAPSSQVVRSQNYNFSITTSPRKLKKTTAAPLGAIGVMISGAVLFNPYEADNTTAALAANFTVKDSSGNDVPFIDPCNGHPNPMGQYHYHGLPPCVTAQVDKASGPSHIIGVAFDGFPIYGDRNIKGKQIRQSQLDACNGITSKTPEFPKGIYHYVLLNVASSRSSLNCLHGKFTRAAAAAVSRQVSYCWVGRTSKRSG